MESFSLNVSDITTSSNGNFSTLRDFLVNVSSPSRQHDPATNGSQQTQQDLTTSGSLLHSPQQDAAVDGGGLVSDASLQEFMDVFSWMMPVLCVLAVVFCVFNAAVYWQQRAAPFALYLVAVDVGDGLCALLELSHTFCMLTLPHDSFAYLFVKWYVAKYFAVSCRRAAVTLNALASLERFVAIAFPLRGAGAPGCCRHAVAIITSVFVSSLGVHLYFALEYSVVPVEGGGWQLAPSAWKLADPDLFVVWSTVGTSIFAYAPVCFILALNVALVVVLKIHASSLQGVRRSQGKDVGGADSKDSKDGGDGGSGKKRDSQTGKMVLVFTTVVLVMALPKMLNSTSQSLLDDYGPKSQEKNLYNTISLLAQITSHLTETALFWTAFAYSRRFRHAVYRLFIFRPLCGQRLDKAKSTTTSSSSSAYTGLTSSKAM